MDAPILKTIIREVGQEKVQLVLEIELARLASLMNVANNLTSAQLPVIALALIETYPTESLADFLLVFKRMAMGFYGKTYHQLDGSTIGNCIGEHIIEKAYYRERDNANSKKAADYVPMVDYAAFKKHNQEKQAAEREAKIKDFEKKVEEKEVKAAYSPSSKMDIAVYKLRSEWIAECKPDPKMAGTPEAEELFLKWLDLKADQTEPPKPEDKP